MLFSNNYKTAPYFENHPRNEMNPSWEDYRLSLSKMIYLKENGNSQWRLTCNFEKDGLVMTDLLIATHENVPILRATYRKNCATVSYVDIRGKNCTNCRISFWQAREIILHVDSTFNRFDCDQIRFDGDKPCGKAGEDDFGYYYCANHLHRCSSSQDATTQLWFGGKMEVE